MQNHSADAVKRRAQARFEQATSRAREAAAAMKDFHAGQVAEADKLIRLRNLRLAKEAADALAEQERGTAAEAAVTNAPSQPAVKRRRAGSAATRK